MNTVMQFGNFGYKDTGKDGITLVEDGYLGGENQDTVILDLSQHQMYILFTREIAISSGNVRGFRAHVIAKPENDGAISRGAMYSSTNSGVTLTNNSDGTLTIKPSSTSYDVYYSLYAVM